MLLSSKTRKSYIKNLITREDTKYMTQRCFEYKQTNCMTVTYLRNSILPRAYEWDERALLSHITKLVLKRVDNTCV